MDSARLLRHLAGVTNVGVFLAGADAKLTFVNAGLAAMLGLRPEEMIGRTVYDFMDEESAALSAEYAERQRLDVGVTAPPDQEKVYRRSDGSKIWVLAKVSPVRGEAGAYEGAVGVVVDITRRKLAEDVLRDRDQMLRELLASAVNAILVISQEGRVLLANSKAEKQLGFESGALAGQRIDELLAAGLLAGQRPEGGSGAPPPGSPRTRTARGKLVRRTDAVETPVETSLTAFTFEGRPATLVIIRNIAAEEHAAELEAQLRQSQKLEAVGTLAGGVAHDFNNLLTVILANAEMSLAGLQPEDPIRGRLEEIRTAATSAADLTRQLLAFSRKQTLQPRVVDLNEILRGMEGMLRRLLREDCELSVRPGEQLWRVRADPGQVEQVVVNLVVNARDAMPNGGAITLETANVWVSGDAQADLTPGPYAVLVVTDTGVGMAPATRDRVFEPFFTTKEKGKGTGLGLSTVFGIVKQSGGHVSVASEVGEGTTFEVYLPRAEAEVERTSPERRASAPPSGNETVLLVEDNAQVRQVTARILRQAGYHVLEAANGAEAFLACERFAAPIQLLLTDIVMPGMSGRELAERLARVRPELRVLFLSGYAEEIVRPGALETGTALLQKPITADSLLRKVREVIGSE